MQFRGSHARDVPVARARSFRGRARRRAAPSGTDRRRLSRHPAAGASRTRHTAPRRAVSVRAQQRGLLPAFTESVLRSSRFVDFVPMKVLPGRGSGCARPAAFGGACCIATSCAGTSRRADTASRRDKPAPMRGYASVRRGSFLLPTFEGYDARSNWRVWRPIPYARRPATFPQPAGEVFGAAFGEAQVVVGQPATLFLRCPGRPFPAATDAILIRAGGRRSCPRSPSGSWRRRA